MRFRLLPMFALTLAALAAGCGDDFASRSEILDYRVLGLEADPPEVGPGDSVRLTAHDLDPAGRPIEYAWTLCLYSVGPLVDFACADPALSFGLGGGATVELDLADYDLRGFAEALGGVPRADGTVATLTDGFDVFVVLESGPSAGPRTRSVKRVRVRDGGEPNRNPTAALRVSAERAAPGATVTLTVEPGPDARETFVDNEGGRATEELVYAWYSTGGALASALTYGDDTEVELELPTARGPVDVVLAVRDGRGGLTVQRRRIEVE
ncbi:MAG: hypothetical protein H6704_04490 [Myxococcales bacterium]|nr:hypothetical protein [Myxococcales bacterium]